TIMLLTEFLEFLLTCCLLLLERSHFLLHLGQLPPDGFTLLSQPSLFLSQFVPAFYLVNPLGEVGHVSVSGDFLPEGGGAFLICLFCAVDSLLLRGKPLG